MIWRSILEYRRPTAWVFLKVSVKYALRLASYCLIALSIFSIPSLVLVVRHGWPIGGFGPALIVWGIFSGLLASLGSVFRFVLALRHLELLPRSLEISTERILVTFNGLRTAELPPKELSCRLGSSCEDTMGWFSACSTSVLLRVRSWKIPNVDNELIIAVPVNNAEIGAVFELLESAGVRREEIRRSRFMLMIGILAVSILLGWAVW